MRKVNRSAFLAGGCALLGGSLLLAGVARADVTSTNSAGLVVFPKLVVDTRGSEAVGTDTIIQLTNTSNQPVNVRCFLVNANGHCSNSGEICNPEGDPAQNPCDQELCVPGWQETDFRLRLTPKQPIMWTVSSGLEKLPLADAPNNGYFNDGNIVPAPENPMVGELKCVQVGEDEAPVDRNDLKGEVTIETVVSGAALQPEGLHVDSRGYNAIGIQAIEGENDGNNTLVLGQEYNACPNVLVLDHFFDDAEEPSDVGHKVRTHLTLVPCSEDFNLQAPISTTVQFLVFNEFEQRFSTSRSIQCFSEIVLSDIDTRPGPHGDAQSIFNVNVQGTLTGQTLIRGVADSATTYGHGLLAIAEEFQCPSFTTPEPSVPIFSSAFVAHQRGARTQLDYVYLPEAAPAQ